MVIQIFTWPKILHQSGVSKYSIFCGAVMKNLTLIAQFVKEKYPARNKKEKLHAFSKRILCALVFNKLNQVEN